MYRDRQKTESRRFGFISYAATDTDAVARVLGWRPHVLNGLEVSGLRVYTPYFTKLTLICMYSSLCPLPTRVNDIMFPRLYCSLNRLPCLHRHLLPPSPTHPTLLRKLKKIIVPRGGVEPAMTVETGGRGLAP